MRNLYLRRKPVKVIFKDQQDNSYANNIFYPEIKRHIVSVYKAVCKRLNIIFFPCMCFSIFFYNLGKRVLVILYLNTEVAIIATYFEKVCSVSQIEFYIIRNYIQIATIFVAKRISHFVIVSYWSSHIFMNDDEVRVPQNL